MGSYDIPSGVPLSTFHQAKFRGGLAVSQYSTDIERHSLRMTEVRVHAAFKVKDESTFLKEAAKIVEATQVQL